MPEGRLPKALLAAALAVALAVLGTGLTGANFSAQTTNPSNSFATALDFCVNGGTQALDATGDAYVSEALPDTNFGTATDLLVEANVLDLILVTGDKRTLVKFDLPAIPSHCDLTAATLKLYATGVTTGRTIDAYRAGASWTEGGRPGTTSPPRRAPRRRPPPRRAG